MLPTVGSSEIRDWRLADIVREKSKAEKNKWTSHP